MKRTEFYIGYSNQIPKGIYQFIKRSFLFLLLIFIVLGVAIAFHHKKGSTGTFELGKISTIKGYYFDEPVALLKVEQGKDIYGKRIFKSIPLVNYAKFGADELIRDYETKHQIRLKGKLLSLEGSFLYDDGKALFELSKREKSFLHVEDVDDHELRRELMPSVEELGIRSIRGEIVDSKCYFGAMRPGFGKTHRACAVRCISGGIPPVLAATNYQGAVNYFLIRGKNKEAINQDVLPYVAEPVTLTGKLVQFDDWMVIYVDPKTGIKRD